MNENRLFLIEMRNNKCLLSFHQHHTNQRRRSGMVYTRLENAMCSFLFVGGFNRSAKQRDSYSTSIGQSIYPRMSSY